jgi:carbonic anhydrase
MRDYRAATSVALLVLAMATGSAQVEKEPVGAIDRLKAGNERFISNPATPPVVDVEKRKALTKGQTPFAMVLSCADSRVPPEMIFNAGLGELFVIRTAGQVTDKAVLASIEYAAEHLNVPALVVMGHDSCGAVKAAIETKAGAPSLGPNLDALVGAIKPAFDRMSTPADLDHLRDAVLANVEEVVNDILTSSAIIKHRADAGKLQIVGAFYELETGRVRFSKPLPVSQGQSADAPGAHR